MGRTGGFNFIGRELGANMICNITTEEHFAYAKEKASRGKLSITKASAAIALILMVVFLF